MTCYCYEILLFCLKDREKLEKLFTLIKMIPESSENGEYICRGDEKIEKIFKLVNNDINSETWGETLLEEEINF